MTTIRFYRDSLFSLQQRGRLLAAVLLVASLATTGCDMVDSNALDEAAQPGPSVLMDATERSIEPVRWVTLPGEIEVLRHVAKDEDPAGWPATHLLGTWVLASADIYVLDQGEGRPAISFWEDGTFTGYAECYNFGGRYRVGSDWSLTIYDFRATQKFCVQTHDTIRETLFVGLREATNFRFEHGTLWVMSQGGKRGRHLIFERMEEDPGANDIGMPPAAAR